MNMVWQPYLQQLTDNSVVILWSSDAGDYPVVRYYNHTVDGVVQGDSRTLDALGTVLHRVQLDGLQPDTSYHYQIHSGAGALLRPRVYSFQTAPKTGSDLPFTFIAFGDYGTRRGNPWRLCQQMLQDTFDFVLTTGDNSQGHGTYQQFDRYVFQVYGKVFGTVAVFPTLGNHDYGTDRGMPYLNLFDLPRNAWSVEDMGRYYSFDYGNTHFAIVDSTKLVSAREEATSDEMLAWLSQDLGQTEQRWKIVSCHHPPYNAGPHGTEGRVQADLVPILEAHGVDLVLSGHQHNYQRSRPLKGGQIKTPDQGGITYVVSGAGAIARHRCGDAGWLAHSICSASYGLYSRITVTGGHLTIEAVDDEGTVRDRDTIVKRSASPPCAVREERHSLEVLATPG
jgi:hypothetical protein